MKTDSIGISAGPTAYDPSQVIKLWFFAGGKTIKIAHLPLYARVGVWLVKKFVERIKA